MTLYICQCPHLRDAKVWTATSEQDAIARLAGEDFDNALDAARDDMRDAYVTEDPLDLFLWIVGSEAPQHTRARGAFLRSYDIRLDVEALAFSDYDEIAEEERYTAFDGRFTWSPNDEEWWLGNEPRVAASGLFEALCEASVVLAVRERMERIDV